LVCPSNDRIFLESRPPEPMARTSQGRRDNDYSGPLCSINGVETPRDIEHHAKPRELPTPVSGSWLELRIDGPGLRRVERVVRRVVEAGDSENELASALESEDFCWPALDEWRDVFEIMNECPGMWDEVLLEAPLRNPYSKRQRGRLRRLSTGAKSLLSRNGQAATVASRALACGRSEESTLDALDELEGAGFCRIAASLREALGTMSMKGLREMQREAGLHGARSKSGLIEILLEGISASDLREKTPTGLETLRGEEPWDEEWWHYCLAVEDLYIHTYTSENYVAEEQESMIEAGVLNVTMSSPVNGIDSICEEWNGMKLSVSDPSAWVLHFPGCRCARIARGFGNDLSITSRLDPRRSITTACAWVVVGSLLGWIAYVLS